MNQSSGLLWPLGAFLGVHAQSSPRMLVAILFTIVVTVGSKNNPHQQIIRLYFEVQNSAPTCPDVLNRDDSFKKSAATADCSIVRQRGHLR